MTAHRAWAIEAANVISGVGLIGVGWFDWALHRPGLPTMTFATRREARAAVSRLRGSFRRVRVVPVEVRIRRLDAAGGG